MDITLASIRWDMIIGGFGLFLFGIKFMGDGLKSVAGDKLRDYIDKYTSTPWKAVLVGALVTVGIQSSSATTAITIGLVRAGLMRLEQAVGIIMGANIGTTITAFLIGMNVESTALYFVFMGSIMISFAARKKFKYLGEVLMGFGLLFYGLRIMGDELKLLKDLPSFFEFAQTMSQQPLLAMFAGTVLTAIIQSSSAVIGIVQKIYDSGGIALQAALPFIFGSNIGTTVTAILAALGGSLAAKRAAGVHTLFNVCGTVIAMCLLVPFVSLIEWISIQFGVPPMMQIAIAHIIFNIGATIIFFPLIKQLCNLIRKIIPGDEPERIEIKIDDLSIDVAGRLPSSALNIAKQAILKMSTVATSACEETKAYFIDGNGKNKEQLYQSEDIINSLDGKISAYLTAIARENLAENDMVEYTLHLQVVKNLERIGDLSVNLIEFFELAHDDRSTFSNSAREDVTAMFDSLHQMLSKAMQVYETSDYSIYSSILEDENDLDLLEYKARQRHFERMANNECLATIAGSVYVDILGTLERMGDHACNIAKSSVDAHSTSIIENH